MRRGAEATPRGMKCDLRTRWMRSLPKSLVFLVACLVAGMAPVYAAEPPPASQECLACHADRDLKRSTRTPGGSESVFVDEAALRASAHGGLACVACHETATPAHEAHLPAVRCDTCHPTAPEEVQGSVHARLGGGGRSAGCIACHGTHQIQPLRTDGSVLCAACHEYTARQMAASVHASAGREAQRSLPTCTTCHTAHAVKSSRDPASPTYRTHIHETCATCHAKPEVVTEERISRPRAVALFEQSIHGVALRAGNLNAATCSDCHGAHEIRRAGDPASTVFHGNVAATCGACHTQQNREFQASIHGVAVAEGVLASPTCSNCHGEHAITATRAPGSRVAPLTVSKTCAACHEAAPVIEEFGLPTGRARSFFGSFHGLAVREGSPVAANCASCHGTHNILPSSDPRSTVNPKNLPHTCGQCHPGAGIQLASAKIHIAPGMGEHPWVTLVRRIYLVIILATIGGMSLHNGLDFFARARERWQASRWGESAEPAVPLEVAHRLFQRLTVNERIQHLVLLTTFTVLVITGFALKFPESWWARPLVRIEGGYAIRAWIHRIAGLLLTLTAVYHGVCLFSTPRGRSQLRAMWPRWRDVQEAGGLLAFNLGLRAARPRLQRFSYVEKLEYWAVAWGTCVMAATGFVMWFETIVLRRWPLWTIDLATVIHYYEAWLATLAILVWHFYSVILRPDVYPMSWVWLSGTLTGRQMAEEHPDELQEILAAEISVKSMLEADQSSSIPTGEDTTPRQDPQPPGPDTPEHPSGS